MHINDGSIPMLCGRGRSPPSRRLRQYHCPPGPVHHRLPALQRRRTNDPVRAAGLARTPRPQPHSALRQDHSQHLSKAYRDAGHFRRNVRTIEIRLDREAVTSGAAATGEPWPRMACARCGFLPPKGSSKAQLLQAKENLQRVLAAIPLTDDERAAVDDGQTAFDQLLHHLGSSEPRRAGRSR